MFASLDKLLRKTGFRNTAAFSLNKLGAQLAGLPALLDGGPWNVSQGRSKWEGFATELRKPICGKSLEHLLQQLALCQPLELTFITHSKPVQPHQGGDRFGVSRITSPAVPGLRELRTYLFLRRPLEPLQESFGDVLRNAWGFGDFDGTFSPLSGDKALAVIQPWAVENGRAPGAVSSRAAFVARQEGVHASHPLQLPTFDLADPSVESWEITTVTTPTWDALMQERRKAKPVVDTCSRGLIQFRSAVLLASKDVPVDAALRERRARFHAAGFATHVIPAGGAYASVVAPWLASMTERPMTLFTSDIQAAARQIAVPRGLSPNAPPFLGDYSSRGRYDVKGQNLAALNLRGGQFPLGPPTGCEMSGTLIAGNAGSGLTYTANAMLAAHLAGGGLAWALREAPSSVFDDVHCATELVLSPQKPICLNPLGGFQAREDLSADLWLLRAWVYGLSVQGGDERQEPDQSRLAAIEAAITDAWQRTGASLGLNEVIGALEAGSATHDEFWGRKAAEVAAALRRGTSSMAQEWFNGPSGIDTAAPYVSFTLSGFPAGSIEGQKIASTVLALHSQVAARDRGRQRRMVLLDSVDLLGDDEGARGVLRGSLIGARMYNVRHVITTRPFAASTPGDETSREALLWNLCPLKALMTFQGHHSESWLKALSREFTPQELSTLGDRRVRSFAWCCGSDGDHGLLPATLKFPVEASVLLAPAPHEAELYALARSQGHTAQEALTRVAAWRASGQGPR